MIYPEWGDTMRSMKWSPRTERAKKPGSNFRIALVMHSILGDLAPSEATVATWFRSGSKGPGKWLTAYRKACKELNR